MKPKKKKSRDSLRERVERVREVPFPQAALKPLAVVLLVRAARRDREFALAALDVIEKIAARELRDDWVFPAGADSLPETLAGVAKVELEDLARRWDPASESLNIAEALELATDMLETFALRDDHGSPSREELARRIRAIWMMLHSSVRPVSDLPPLDILEPLIDRVMTARTHQARAHEIVMYALGGDRDDLVRQARRAKSRRAGTLPPRFVS